MIPRALIVAAAAWAVANAAVLAGAVWNRMGAPTGRLVIDECALEAGYGTRAGLRLAPVSHYHPAEPVDQAAALAALGFGPIDGDRHPADGRRAFVAVEAAGDAVDAYRDHITGEADRAMDPRPVVRDAAADPQTLTARYAGHAGVAVTRGIVRPRLSGSDGNTDTGGATLVPSLRITDLHLSLDQRRYLWSLPYKRADDCTARFQAIIHYGRRWHPWVADLRPLPPADDPPAGDVTPRSPSTGPGR